MTNDNTNVYLGVDVSKNTLDLSSFDKKSRRIPNTRHSIKSLIKRIQALDLSVVVTCEATGGYENLLIGELIEAGIPVCRANSMQVKSFIRSQAVTAKTDTLDAKMIAHFAEVRDEKGTLFRVDKAAMKCGELRDLVERRNQLKKVLIQEQNRLDPLPEKSVAADIGEMISYLQEKIKRIEKMADEWLEKHVDIKELYDRLNEVVGLGRMSCLTLIAYVPELGKVSRQRIASLVGLAPYNHESGKTTNPMHIRGGRPEPRKVLYMASLSASRRNPILTEYYQKLKGQGKPSKVALIAVARRLLVLANTIAKDPDFKPA